MGNLLTLSGVEKQYNEKTRVLLDLNLEVGQGESVGIIGASGCGKSTLLNIIGTLDRPDSGSICFDEVDLRSLNEKKAAEFRNTQIGFVFQLHHLLPQCTVLENVLIPTLVNKGSVDAKERAVDMLERVGLSDRVSHRPGELSGGERQRVAVVRALINQPKLLLADEPTGALNRAGADSLMDVLLKLNREKKLTLIMVTHSMRLAKQLDRVLALECGRLNPCVKPET